MGAAAVFVVLFLVSSVAWFTGERERSKLNEELGRRNTTLTRMQGESTFLKTQNDSLNDKIKDFETRMEASDYERKKLEDALARETASRDEALKNSDHEKLLEKEREMNDLQVKLNQEAFARRSLEEEIKNIKLAEEQDAKVSGGWSTLDIDRLSAKLKDASSTLQRLKSSGIVKGELVASLEAQINEAQRIIGITVKKRAEFGKDALSLDQLQKEIRDKTKDEFKQRVSTLEGRLISLDEDKKAINEKFTETMTAIINLEEAAKRIEAELSGEGSDQQLKIGASGKSDKLVSDLEALRKGRDTVRQSVEKVKNALENMMSLETKKMREETSGIAVSYSKLLSSKGDGGPDSSPEALARRLENLNMLLDAAATKVKAEKGESAEPGYIEAKIKFMEKCEDDFKAKMSGKTVPDSYVVKKGDNLWDISMSVYGNPYLWPIIYTENKNLIQDPDLIVTGSRLHIKKNLTQDEMAAAVEHAKRNGPLRDADGNVIWR